MRKIKEAVDGLTNLKIDGDYAARYRLHLDKAVTFAKFWFYNIHSYTREGYSEGDGGKIRVTIRQSGRSWVSTYCPTIAPYLCYLDFGRIYLEAGEFTVTFEQIGTTGWASVNAMLKTKDAKQFGRESDEVDVIYKGEVYRQYDKVPIWDLADSDCKLLDVGYNYYEAWYKAPHKLGLVKQVGPMGDLKNFVLRVQGTKGNVIANVCGMYAQGVVDGIWMRFTLSEVVRDVQEISFLTDINADWETWPVRKAVTPFYASIGTRGRWPYWASIDNRCSVLQLVAE